MQNWVKKIFYVFLLLLSVFAFVAYWSSAEKRIRTVFHIDSNIALTEEAITRNALDMFPTGSPKEKVLCELEKLKEYLFYPKAEIVNMTEKNRLFIRFNHSDIAMNIVAEEYAVEFLFDDKNKLWKVVSHVWLTGP